MNGLGLPINIRRTLRHFHHVIIKKGVYIIVEHKTAVSFGTVDSAILLIRSSAKYEYKQPSRYSVAISYLYLIESILRNKAHNITLCLRKSKR